MSGFKVLSGAMLAVALLAATVPAQAAGPLTERTEKLRFESKKGKSFLQPGFALGEYSGLSRQSATSTSALGLYSSAKSKAEISVTSPSLGAVTIKCKGGESRTALGWITFDRDKLAYVCTFEGAGPEAAFTLVQSKGGLLARLQTPQRAAELRLGAVTLRAESKPVGAMPFGLTAGAVGYVIRNGDQDVAAVDLSGLSKIAYLPPSGAAERDAAAVMAVILILFMDNPV
jgi:hypothetical protein